MFALKGQGYVFSKTAHVLELSFLTSKDKELLCLSCYNPQCCLCNQT